MAEALVKLRFFYGWDRKSDAMALLPTLGMKVKEFINRFSCDLCNQRSITIAEYQLQWDSRYKLRTLYESPFPLLKIQYGKYIRMYWRTISNWSQDDQYIVCPCTSFLWCAESTGITFEGPAVCRNGSHIHWLRTPAWVFRILWRHRSLSSLRRSFCGFFLRRYIIIMRGLNHVLPRDFPFFVVEKYYGVGLDMRVRKRSMGVTRTKITRGKDCFARLDCDL